MNHHTDSRTSVELTTRNSLLQGQSVLNKGTDEELICWGYRKSAWKQVLFYFIVVFTLGAILLVIRWKPEIGCYLRWQHCSLHKAQYVLLKTRFGTKTVIKVEILFEPIDGDHAGNYTESPAGSTTDVSDNSSLLRASWVSDHDSGLHYFDYQHTRYIWDQIKSAFRKLEDLSIKTTCHTLHERYKGMRRLYGSNSMIIEVPSYWELLVNEVLNPFYIFQIGSITLWSIDEYYYYAACIFFISAMSITISLVETRKQRVTLRNMVATEERDLEVCNEKQEFVLKREHLLVPGDVIAIPAHGCVMSCDAVLTAGTCIVNESMLTGESVPVTKTPLMPAEDEEIYSPETHKRHTLFSGTKIVQTRYYGQAKVTAVVVRTGYNTAKGELVRAILFPKPLDFKFYRDALRFILFLAGVACLGMAYSVYTYIKYKESWDRTLIRALDIVTIIVPPALPAAMTTGTLTEDGLDMWGVVPVSNQRFAQAVPDPSTLERGPLLVSLATCHSLTIIDGELSGDPLDLIMFNAIKWHLEEPGADTHKFDIIAPTVVKPYSADTFLGEEEEFEYLQREEHSPSSMAKRWQHSLSIQEEENNTEHPFEVGIIKQFTFSSVSQCMSVITRTMGENHMDIFCKGAPEKIASLCKPETVPQDFPTVLHNYSIQGFRVIALAYRPMDPKITWHHVQRISRDKVENDLIFLGLLVMQNQLKPQTMPVIRTLKEADIRTVMITGDMIQTAISVARNCRMVGKHDKVILVRAHAPDKENPARVEFEETEHLACTEDTVDIATDKYTRVQVGEIKSRNHLAVSGRCFGIISSYFPEILSKICVQGTIFARMSPEQKCQLIEHLQALDYTVGMCGDGANDCEALKAAHAGISLSEAEASVAAPFTSCVNNIECVVTAMREGRAALVTSFGCFKYMALYSFIQFISVLILYTYLTNLSDFEFLYIDLIITTTIAILMGNTAAYKKLVKKKPPGSLVKLSNLISILSQVLLSFVFQIGAYLYLSKVRAEHPHQFRFEMFVNGSLGFSNQTQGFSNGTLGENDAKEAKSWESSTIFLVSSYMYIAVAFTFSKGPPFRKPIYTNVIYTITLVVLFGFSTFLLLMPLRPITDFLDMMPMDQTSLIHFRLVLFEIALAFMVASYITEWIIVESGWLKCFYRAVSRWKKAQRSKYKVIQQEIDDSDWPPLEPQILLASCHSSVAKDAVVDVEEE
ncbi:cation-transporting ATPase 13A3 [Biomphalaria pfeifferi]|uniref:Cation-transporting ATPase n=1 Tax=Biomphalaria pfeifferi TaxID=112525 RepID=A0AAD8FBB8_BIOPF|nr:cation-transporting ATPase 13A3 [Biomphalaria pfeifferi]